MRLLDCDHSLSRIRNESIVLAEHFAIIKVRVTEKIIHLSLFLLVLVVTSIHSLIIVEKKIY